MILVCRHCMPLPNHRSDRSRRLTPEQRAEAISRCSAGEQQTVVACDFGVSRQAISLLMQRRNQPAKRKGPPKLPAKNYDKLTLAQRHWLEIEVASGPPAGFSTWTPEIFAALISSKFSVEIAPNEFTELCRNLAVAVHRTDPVASPEILSTYYYAWLKSADAAALFANEAAAWSKEQRRRQQPGYKHYARGCIPPPDDGGPQHSDLAYTDGFTGQLMAWRKRMQEERPEARALARPTGHRVEGLLLEPTLGAPKRLLRIFLCELLRQ